MQLANLPYTNIIRNPAMMNRITDFRCGSRHGGFSISAGFSLLSGKSLSIHMTISPHGEDMTNDA